MRTDSLSAVLSIVVGQDLVGVLFMESGCRELVLTANVTTVLVKNDQESQKAGWY